MLGAYALFYVAMALYSLKDIAHPIWSTCNNWWNTDHCQQLKENFTFEVGRPKSSHEFPAAEFWHNFVAEGRSCGILLRVGLDQRYLTIFND